MFRRLLLLVGVLALGLGSVSPALAHFDEEGVTFGINLEGGVDIHGICCMNKDGETFFSTIASPFPPFTDTIAAAAVKTGEVIDGKSESFDIGFIGMLSFHFVFNGVFELGLEVGYAERGAEFNTFNISDLNLAAGLLVDRTETAGNDVDLEIDTITFPVKLMYLFSGDDFVPFVGLLLDFYWIFDAKLNFKEFADVDLEKVPEVTTGVGGGVAVAGGTTLDVIEDFGFGIGGILGFYYFVNENWAISFKAAFSYSLTELLDEKNAVTIATQRMNVGSPPQSADPEGVFPDPGLADVNIPKDPHVHLCDIWIMLDLTYFWG